MARLLDVMKRADNGHRASAPSIDPAIEVRAVPAPENVPEDDDAAMPYIEVGPHRHVEGSPDVLGRQPQAQAEPATAAGVLRAVTFRPLAASRAERSGIAPEVIAFHEPSHPVSEQYRDLFGSLLTSVAGRIAPALLFTGSLASVGTTTISLNVAVTAARQDRRVVVIDANMRRPAVAARLSLCDRPGLAEVLLGTATLEDALQETEVPGLVALTSGGPAVTAPRTAESYRSLLRQLRQRFDLILIDAPRWDGRAEVVAPATACDATYLVVPAGAHAAPATEELLRQLPGSGARVAGCVAAAR